MGSIKWCVQVLRVLALTSCYVHVCMYEPRYESFVIPLQERARLTSGVEGQAIGFEILGHISDAVFILDIVVNFRTFLITIDRGQEVLIRDMYGFVAACLLYLPLQSICIHVCHGTFVLD